MMKKIDFVDYNPSWPAMFEEEVSFIKKAVGEHFVEAFHIGSTSIKGLKSKNQIDIICVVDDVTKVVDYLKGYGFICKGELNIPLRYYFSRKENDREINLHVVEPNCGFTKVNLCFKDYLEKNENSKNEYINLKEKLLKDESSLKKDTQGFSGYNKGKNDFIINILEKANFSDFRITFCMHDDEWSTYHRIKKEQIFDLINVSYDEKHFSITNENYYHFVLYKGIDIVSVAHVECMKEEKILVIRGMATDEPCKRKGYASFLLKFLEKWARKNGFKKIVLHSNLKAENFYRKNGYIDIVFDDEAISNEIVDLGKDL